MFKSLLPTLLGVAVLVSSCAAAPFPPSKTDVVALTQMSTVRLMAPIDNDHTAICTGFIVDPSHVLTVRHCVLEGLSQNGLPVDVEKVSSSLALLNVHAIVGPPLKIRKEPLKAGEEVVGLGYGLGVFHVFTRFVAIPVYEGTEVILDGLMLQGMSGGPVVDLQGRVVGIIQSGHQGTITLLCGQDEITKFLK